MPLLITAAAMIAQPVAADFDLARASRRTISREEASPAVPAIPRNMDMRDFAVDMPELEVQVVNNGPVFLMGAMGGRHKGMPALAHVALGWSF
jgi:hypothetical protein